MNRVAPVWFYYNGQKKKFCAKYAYRIFRHGSFYNLNSIDGRHRDRVFFSSLQGYQT